MAYFEIPDNVVPLSRHLKARPEQLVADPNPTGHPSNGRETTNINHSRSHLSAFRTSYSIMFCIVPV
jgi:hypothetical protein